MYLIFLAIFWQPCFKKSPDFNINNKEKLHIIILYKFEASIPHFIKYNLKGIRKRNIQYNSANNVILEEKTIMYAQWEYVKTPKTRRPNDQKAECQKAE